MKLIYRIGLAKLPRLTVCGGVGQLVGPEKVLLGAWGQISGQALPDGIIHHGDGGGIVDSCTSGINDIFHNFHLSGPASGAYNRIIYNFLGFPPEQKTERG
nr:MAG TPA: hypothetical protein [Caudoviricetes sp.]